MRTFHRLIVAALFALFAVSASAAHTQARLILANESARPGDTVLAGVHLKMEPGFHTYWKNPGTAGMATKIEWHLPSGITAGEIQWPVPEKFPPEEITTYGYENDAVLFVPLTLAANLKPGAFELKANVSWLECTESNCVPGKGEVQATIAIGNETKASADAALIKSWKYKMPRTDISLSFRAHWEKPASDDARPLIIEGSQMVADTLAIDKVDFFPGTNDGFEVQGAAEKIDSKLDFGLRKVVKKFSGDWPTEISGLIVIEGNKQTNGFDTEVPISNGDNASTSISPAPSEGKSLWRMLLYAFIGGLILNIMPCVLPVIALKILGFVGEARNDPRHVRKLGLVYTLGVLVSFLALAAIVIAVKAAGHKAGWGMQFGNANFLIALTILVVLVALNLFGVFEVTLSGRAMCAAGTLASRQGSGGAFFNGILATVLATPCTAPFLSVALGFAFAQSTAIILLIFLSVGVGLALPYLILSFQPAWLKFLPKPGAWMEKFKMFMGFPMLATGVWLFTITSGSLDKSKTLWFGLFLVVLALGVWIWGEFVQRSGKRRGLAMTISVLLVGGFGVYAFTRGADQIEWQPWSAAAVDKARAEGRPVLVDFTADWCLTCQVNKKVAIEIPSVRAKLKQISSVNLIGDYTHLPDNITDELNRFNRAGVPLVLVYPGKADTSPIVLPEVLTPGTVLDALDRAAKN